MVILADEQQIIDFLGEEPVIVARGGLIQEVNGEPLPEPRAANAANISAVIAKRYDRISHIGDTTTFRLRRYSFTASLTGIHEITRDAVDVNNNPVPIRAIKVHMNKENLSVLLQLSRDWEKQARELSIRTGSFAADTAWYGAKCTTRTITCSVMAAMRDSQVEGLAVYEVTDGLGKIDLFTTAPKNQPDSRSPDKIKGVGRILLDAVRNDMRRLGAREIILSPLNREAADWWQSQGFTRFDSGMRIDISQLVPVAYYYEEDASLAGDPDIIRRIRVL